MNSQQPQILIKKLLLTIKGELQPPQSSTIYILPHQSLHFLPSKTQIKPLTLQTLSNHRSNPLSLQNTSVTPTLIQHQLHSQLALQPNKNKQVLIIDSSSNQHNQKTAQVFKKYNIIRGYQYQLPFDLTNNQLKNLSKELQVLISKQNIKKQIDYTFGVISDQQRGFIGQIDLMNHLKLIENGSIFYKQAFVNLISSYGQFTVKTQCPIFINLLNNGQQGYKFVEDKPCQSLQKSIKFLNQTLGTNKQSQKSIILVNPQFQLKSTLQQNSIRITNLSDSQIQNLYKQNFTLLFDLSRYQSDFCITWISQYILQWPNQTIISAGLKYKTDFQQFGGQGLAMNSSLKIINKILGNKYEQLMNKVTKQNILKLLIWYEKKIIKVQVKMWKCVKCNKQSPQTQQSFRKFGKDFCSIDCLRAFNF